MKIRLYEGITIIITMASRCFNSYIGILSTLVNCLLTNGKHSIFILSNKSTIKNWSKIPNRRLGCSFIVIKQKLFS